MVIINGQGIVQYNFEATVDEELTVDRGEQVTLNDPCDNLLLCSSGLHCLFPYCLVCCLISSSLVCCSIGAVVYTKQLLLLLLCCSFHCLYCCCAVHDTLGTPAVLFITVLILLLCCLFRGLYFCFNCLPNPSCLLALLLSAAGTRLNQTACYHM